MTSSFLSKGNESVCVVKQKNQSSYLVYKLERRERYGFHFYGIFHKFEMALNHDITLSDHDYGLLSSCVDLSGRISTRRRKPAVFSSGKKIITLERPVYSFIGEYDQRELQKVLRGYSPSFGKHDLPYASISTSVFAIGDAGDDFYLNTLFFMTKGYGILTEISAVAGRDIEDCCSPEYYYKAYKVQLKSNPLKRIQKNDIVPEAALSTWKVSSDPELVTPIEVKFNDNQEKIKKLDRLIDELFIQLKTRIR